MTILCTYILTKDTGLAPNPFWGWCTLSLCTPNRQGAKLGSNDWVAGFSPRKEGHRLIYAMKVEERIHLNDYFHDARFASKKPDLSGDWRQRCGDNFYSQDNDGQWHQHRNRYHIDSSYLLKDTRRPFAFVSQQFWYFGDAALPVPEKFMSLIGERGIRTKHSAVLVHEFIDWVQQHKPGISGNPRHNPDLETRLSKA